MGLNSVALDLLLRIHPMSSSQSDDQAGSSSRQDLKNDMQELEAAGFLKPCKDTPDSWEFGQVSSFTTSFASCCLPHLLLCPSDGMSVPRRHLAL